MQKKLLKACVNDEIKISSKECDASDDSDEDNGVDYIKAIKIVLTVCSYHVTYAFQSESTLYICLNVKEILDRNRRDI